MPVGFSWGLFQLTLSMLNALVARCGSVNDLPSAARSTSSMVVRAFDAVATEFDDVTTAYHHVDAACIHFVQDPGRYDVIVTDNLFGDILTDLAAAIQGGMGMAASANTAPGTAEPGLFEPVHGSAPDIAGQGVANPVGAIWSAVLMLEHVGEVEAATRLMRALEETCREGPRTRDVGGSATTREAGDAVIARLG